MPEPQWQPYEYPQLDIDDYNDKLEALLWRRFYAGELVVEGKTMKPTSEKHRDQVTNYVNHLIRQTTLEGVNPRLPFYNEVITATMTPEWYQGQVGQYAQEWAGWGEEQARTQERDWQRQFGVQQWQQAEAWRRYGAETQQQQQRQQFEWQKTQAHMDLMRQREFTKEAQYNLAQQRYARGLTGGGAEEWQVSPMTATPQGMQLQQYQGGLPAPQQQQMAGMWNQWQGRLAGEASWPQSELIRAQPNPFEVTPESIGDEITGMKSELERAKEVADYYRARMKDSDDPLTQTGISVPTTPEQAAASGALQREAVIKGQLEDIMETREAQDWSEWKGKQETRREKERELGWGETWGRDAPPKLPPPMPATPAFLQKVYPELGARLPREKAEAPMYPLSGQQWGQMLPSQRGQWAGYIDWAGGKPEDLYAQMQQMTPQYRPGAKWSPARQF